MATTIFEQQTLTFAPNDSYGGLYAYMDWNMFVLVEGETYEVHWGEDVYTLKAEVMSWGDVSGIGIGNKAIFGIGANTEEPFIMAYTPVNEGNAIFLRDQSTSHTIAIYQINSNDVVLKNYHGTPVTYEGVNYVALKKTDGGTAMFVSEHLVQNQVQADWAQTDETAVDYIKNKPEAELPAVTTEDNDKVLAVVNGVWDKVEANFGSGQSGTIEKDVTIEWNTSNVAISFEIPFTGMSAYKIAEATPTKEQLLSANYNISDYKGNNTFNVTIADNGIMLDDENMFGFQITDLDFGYLVLYKSGEMTALFQGNNIPINVPETGIYQIWDTDIAFPTTMFGSITYKIIEEVNFVQSNWNQNDQTKPDYIKNRPFYAGSAKEYDVLPEQTFEFERSKTDFNGTISGFAWNETYQMYSLQQNEPSFTLNSNTEYEVIWDNEEPLICKTFEFTLDSDPSVWIGVGNGKVVGFESTEPFMFAYNADYNILMLGTDSNLESHSIEIGEASPRIGGVQTEEYKLEQGQVYHIAWDETVYECKSRVSSGNPADAVIGNVSAMREDDIEDLALPFGIVYNKESNVIFIVSYTNESSHTLRIYQSEENIKKIDQKFVGTDWNQSDENDAGYIKNRPFYADKKVNEILPERTMVVSDSTESVVLLSNEQLALWENGFDKAIVVWEGVTYECKPEIYDGFIAIGNVELLEDKDNGIPFIMVAAPNEEDATQGGIFVIVSSYDSEPTEHTFSVSVVTEDLAKIDPKFLPSIEWSKISNKPFGTITAGEVIYSTTANCNIATPQEGVYGAYIDYVDFVLGLTYTVILDGISYQLTCMTEDEDKYVAQTEGDVQFTIRTSSLGSAILVNNQGEHTISIAPTEDIVKKIDAKYLPDDIGGTPAIDTTADEGKFLRVVGGVAVWSTVPNAEEVSF